MIRPLKAKRLRASRRIKPRHLAVEQLEERRLLTITSTFNNDDTDGSWWLTVSSDASDNIVITNQDGLVKIDGNDPQGNGQSFQVPANAVQHIHAIGGPGTLLIDLSAVSDVNGFSSMVDTQIDFGSLSGLGSGSSMSMSQADGGSAGPVMLSSSASMIAGPMPLQPISSVGDSGGEQTDPNAVRFGALAEALIGPDWATQLGISDVSSFLQSQQWQTLMAGDQVSQLLDPTRVSTFAANMFGTNWQQQLGVTDLSTFLSSGAWKQLLQVNPTTGVAANSAVLNAEGNIQQFVNASDINPNANASLNATVGSLTMQASHIAFDATSTVSSAPSSTSPTPLADFPMFITLANALIGPDWRQQLGINDLSTFFSTSQWQVMANSQQFSDALDPNLVNNFFSAAIGQSWQQQLGVTDLPTFLSSGAWRVLLPGSDPSTSSLTAAPDVLSAMQTGVAQYVSAVEAPSPSVSATTTGVTSLSGDPSTTIAGTLQMGSSNDDPAPISRTVKGSQFDNTITGTNDDDTLDGGEGDDTINALNGNSTIDGGEGNDTLDGGEGNDQIYGDSGDNMLDGGEGTNLLNGGPGNNRYQFTGAAYGSDTIINGAGTATLDLSELDLGTGVNLNLADSGPQVVAQTPPNIVREQLTLTGLNYITNVIGTKYDDTIIGNSNNDQIDGGGGQDTLTGGGGFNQYILPRTSSDGPDRIMETANETVDVGAPWQVGQSFASSSSATQAVAVDGLGNSIHIWQPSGSGGSEILGQRFDSNGDALGSTFTVTASSTAAQPRVSADATGDFVVSWQDHGTGGTPNVFYRRYQLLGDNLVTNNPVQINSADQTSNAFASPLLNDDGTLAVVWQADAAGGNGSPNIYLAIFGANDQPVSASPELVAASPSSGAYPTQLGNQGVYIAHDANGGLAVAWRDDENGFSQQIFVRQYDAAGNALGSAITIVGPNDLTEFTSLGEPSLSSDGAGRLWVTWSQQTPDPDSASASISIGTREFDPSQGAWQPTAVLIDTQTDAWDSFPGGLSVTGISDMQTATDGSGHLAVAWTQSDSNYATTSYVQWFSANGQPIAGATRLDGSVASGGQAATVIASNLDGHMVAAWDTDSTISARAMDFAWVPPATTAGAPPALNAIPDQTLRVGATLNLTLQAIYPAGSLQNVVMALASQNPSGVTLTPSPYAAGQVALRWVPATGTPQGWQTIAVDVYDATNPALETQTNIQVWYGPANQPPSLQPIRSQTVTVGETVTFTASAHDPDGPDYALRYQLAANAPAGAVLNPLTGVFSWAPTAASVGTNTFSVYVTDSGHPPQTVSQSVTINVLAANVPPSITAPSGVQLNEGSSYVFHAGTNGLSIADSDSGGNVLDLSLVATSGLITLGSTSNLTFEAGSSTNSPSSVVKIRGTLSALNAALNGLTFTPTASFQGTAQLSLNASDLGDGGVHPLAYGSATVPLSVAVVQTAPVLAAQAVSIPGSPSNGDLVTTATATNPDPALILTYSITAGNTNGAFTIDPLSGQITVNDATQLPSTGQYVLTVEASYLRQPTLYSTAQITILVGRQGPTAVADNYTLSANSSLSGNVVTGDALGGSADTSPNGDVLSVIAATDSDGNTVLLGHAFVLPSGATLTLNTNGSFTYDTSTSTEFAQLYFPNQTQTDSFKYTIVDAYGATSQATVNLTVHGITPVFTVPNQTFTVAPSAAAGTKLGVLLVGNQGGEPLTYEIQSGDPTNNFVFDGSSNQSEPAGELDVNDGAQLVAGQQYSLLVGVTDSFSRTVTANVTIDVAANQTPVVPTQNYLTPKAIPLSGNLLTDDTGQGIPFDPVVGQTMYIASVNGLAYDVGRKIALHSGATVTINADGSFNYDPTTSPIFADLGVGQTGTDTIPVTVRDGYSEVSAGLVITIQGRNDPPVAHDKSYQAVGGTILSGNIITDQGVGGGDADPNVTDTLQVVSIDSTPLATSGSTTIQTWAGATLTINSDGSFQYDPSSIPNIANLQDTQLDDWFTYAIADNNGSGPVWATVHLSVLVPLANNAATLEVDNFGLVNDLGSDATGHSATDPTVSGTITSTDTGIDHYVVQLALNVASDGQGHYVEPSSADVQLPISTATPGWQNFSYDPVNSLAFSTTPGTKVFAYRVEAFSSSSSSSPSDETSWNYFTFQYGQPATQGSIRLANGIQLYNVTTTAITSSQPGQVTPPPSNETTDPRLYGVVDGNFAGQTVEVKFSYARAGTTYNGNVTLTAPNDFIFDPRTIDSGLAQITAETNLVVNYQLVVVGTNGAANTVVQTGTFSFDLDPLPQPDATLEAFTEVTNAQPGYLGTTRVVQGTVDYAPAGDSTNSGATNSETVYVDFQYSDANGLFLDNSRVDGETEAAADPNINLQSSGNLDFQYTAVGLQGLTPEIRARVKQWSANDGAWLYGPWSSPLALSPITAPAIHTLAASTTQVNGETIPILQGSLVPSTSTSTSPTDLSGVAYVTVQFYDTNGTITSSTPLDGTAITDANGNFTYTPHHLSYNGPLTLSAQTVITVAGVSTPVTNEYPSPKTLPAVQAPPVPTLTEGNFGLVVPTQQNSAGQWVTDDPRVTGTLTANSIPGIGFQDVQIQFAEDDGTPSDAQTQVVGSTTPDSSGAFTFDPLNLPTGAARVRARVTYYDSVLNTTYVAGWVNLLLDYTPKTNAPNAVTNLQLVNPTTSDSPPHATDPTISGEVTDPQGYTALVGVNFREASTQAALGSTTTDAQGNFTYTFSSLSPGTHTIEAQAQQWNYVTHTLVWGPWTTLSTGDLTFVLDATQATQVSAFSLQSATGTPSNGTSVTANPLLVGQISSGDSIASVPIAISVDGSVVTTVTTDENGYFSYLPVALTYAQHTVEAQIATWNDTTHNYTYSGGQTFSFILQQTTGAPTTIAQFQLANPPSGNSPVADATLTGQISSEDTVQGVTIEFDYGDNAPNGYDESTTTDAYGRFTFTPTLLQPGTATIRARVQEANMAPGAWVNLTPQTFQYQPPTSVPTITSFAPQYPLSGTPPQVADPQVVGTATSPDGQTGLTAEFSWSGSNATWSTIGTASLDSNGNFSFLPTGLVANTTYTLWVRVKEPASNSSSGFAYSQPTSTEFVYTPQATSGGTIATLRLLNDTGSSSTDGATSDGRITGTVAGISPLAGLTIDIDLNGDGVPDTTVTTGSNGSFEYDPTASFLTTGFHSIRARAEYPGGTTPWQTVNFVFDPNGSAQSLALVSAFANVDPNWQSDNNFSTALASSSSAAIYQSSLTNADADHSYQVALADLARETTENQADATYNAQQNAAQTAYNNAMQTAQATFTQSVGSQKTYTLTAFTWPAAPDDNALVIPADSAQPQPPAAPTYDVSSFDVTQDPDYQDAVATVQQTYQTNVQTAQQTYQTNVQGLQSTYNNAVQTDEQTYQSDVQQAQSDFDTARNNDSQAGDAQLQAQIQSLSDDINKAWRDDSDAVQANEDEYTQVWNGAQATEYADLQSTQNDENNAYDAASQAWINSDHSIAASNALAQADYNIRKEYAPDYQKIYDAYDEAIVPAQQALTKANATAWQTALHAIYPDESQISVLSREQQHDDLSTRLDDQHQYTEDLATDRDELAENLATAQAELDEGTAAQARIRDNSIAGAQQTETDSISQAAVMYTRAWATGVLQADSNTPFAPYDTLLTQYEVDLAIDADAYQEGVAQLALTRDQAKAEAVYSASMAVADATQTQANAVAQAGETQTVDLDEQAVEFQVSADSQYASRDETLSSDWFSYLGGLVDIQTKAALDSADIQEKHDLTQDKAENAEAEIDPDDGYGYGWATSLWLERDDGSSYLAQDDSQTLADAQKALAETTAQNNLNYWLALQDVDATSDSSSIDANTSYLKDANQAFHDAAYGVADLTESYQIDVATIQDSYNVNIASAAADYAVALAKSQAGQNYQDTAADSTYDNNEATLAKTQNVQDATNQQAFEEGEVNDYITALDSWIGTGQTPTPWQSYQLALAGDELTRVTQLGDADIQHASNLGNANVTQTTASSAANMTYATAIYGGSSGGGAYVDEAQAIAEAQVTIAGDSGITDYVTEVAGAVKEHDQAVADANLTLDNAVVDANAARDHAANQAWHDFTKSWDELLASNPQDYPDQYAALYKAENQAIAATEVTRSIASAKAEDAWTHTVGDLNVTLVEQEVSAQQDRASKQSQEIVTQATAVADAESTYKEADAAASQQQTVAQAQADAAYDNNTASADATYSQSTSDATGAKSVQDALAQGNYQVAEYTAHDAAAAAHYGAVQTPLALFQMQAADADLTWAIAEANATDAYQVAVNGYSTGGAPGVEATLTTATNAADLAQAERSSAANLAHSTDQAATDSQQAVALAEADSALYLAQEEAQAGLIVAGANTQGQADIAQAQAQDAHDDAYSDADLAWTEAVAPVYAAYDYVNGSPSDPKYADSIQAANDQRTAAQKKADDDYNQALAASRADADSGIATAREEYVTATDTANLAHVQATNAANEQAATESAQNDMQLTVTQAQSDEVHQDELLTADYNHTVSLDNENVLLAEGMPNSPSAPNPDVVRATSRATAEAAYDVSAASAAAAQWGALAAANPTNDQLQFQKAASAAQLNWTTAMQSSYVTFSTNMAAATSQAAIAIAIAQATQDENDANATFVYGTQTAGEDGAHTINEAQAEDDSDVAALQNQDASALALAQANSVQTDAYAAAQSTYEQAADSINADNNLSSTAKADALKDATFTQASADADADLTWRTAASQAEYDFATAEAARQYQLLQRQAALEDTYASNVARDQAIRDIAFASDEATDQVSEQTVDNTERYGQASATASFESAEKGAQVGAMGTLVNDMPSTPWAVYEQGLATAEQNAWADVNSAYLALQSNINSAYTTYTQTRANAYLTSATQIANDQEQFTQASAADTEQEVDANAQAESNFSLQLAEITSQYRSLSSQAQHEQDLENAQAAHDDTTPDNTQSHDDALQAQDQYTSGYAQADAQRQESIAQNGYSLVQQTAALYISTAGGEVSAEAADDSAVAGAYYSSATGSTALENQVASLNQAYNVAEGAARVTRLTSFANSTGTAWAVLAAATASNNQTYLVVPLAADEAARELQYASAENQYTVTTDATDRNEWLLQVQADAEQSLLNAATALGLAATGSGNDVSPPADLVLPDPDTGAVTFVTSSSSVYQPGPVSDGWYSAYGYGYWGSWNASDNPFVYDTYLGGYQWGYAWAYGTYSSSFANPYAYFAGVSNYYATSYYYGGWAYSPYGWYGGYGWAGSFPGGATIGLSAPLSLSSNSAIDVQGQLDGFDATVSDIAGRVNNVQAVIDTPQDQTPPTFDPATGDVQLGATTDSGSGGGSGGGGAEDPSQGVNFTAPQFGGALATQASVFRSNSALDCHAPLPQERLPLESMLSAVLNKPPADPDTIGLPPPPPLSGSSGGMIQAGIVQAMAADKMATFVQAAVTVAPPSMTDMPNAPEFSHYTQQAYAVVSDVVGTNIVTQVLQRVEVKNASGFNLYYKLVYSREDGIADGATIDNVAAQLATYRTTEWASKVVDIFVTDKNAIQSLQQKEAVLQAGLAFTLNVVPGYAGLQHLQAGNTGQAILSFTGDAALALTGLKALAAANGLARTAKGLEVTAVALNGTIGTVNLGQSAYAFINGETGKAAGYLGEAFLRLYSVRVALKPAVPSVTPPPSLPAVVVKNNLTAAQLAEVENVQSVLMQLRDQAVQIVASGNGNSLSARRLAGMGPGDALYAATYGKAVEREFFRLIGAAQKSGTLTPNLVTDASKAFSDFKLPNDYGGPRPDVRLALGNGQEAVWDLTTIGEVGRSLQGHAGPRYAARDFVDYVSDLPYQIP